jgi:hypothetical protein
MICENIDLDKLKEERDRAVGSKLLNIANG